MTATLAASKLPQKVSHAPAAAVPSSSAPSSLTGPVPLSCFSSSTSSPCSLVSSWTAACTMKNNDPNDVTADLNSPPRSAVEPQWPMLINVGGRVFALGPGSVAKSKLLSAVATAICERPMGKLEGFSAYQTANVVLRGARENTQEAASCAATNTSVPTTATTTTKVALPEGSANATAAAIPFVDRDADEFVMLVEYLRTGELHIPVATASAIADSAEDVRKTAVRASPANIQPHKSTTFSDILLSSTTTGSRNSSSDTLRWNSMSTTTQMIRKLRQCLQFYEVPYPQVCENCHLLFDPAGYAPDACIFHDGTLQLTTDTPEQNQSKPVFAYSCCGLPFGSLGCRVAEHIATAQLFPVDASHSWAQTSGSATTAATRNVGAREESIVRDISVTSSVAQPGDWRGRTRRQQPGSGRPDIRSVESYSHSVAPPSSATSSTGLDFGTVEQATSSHGFAEVPFGFSGGLQCASADAAEQEEPSEWKSRCPTLGDEDDTIENVRTWRRLSCCPCTCPHRWSRHNWSHSSVSRSVTPKQYYPRRPGHLPSQAGRLDELSLLQDDSHSSVQSLRRAHTGCSTMSATLIDNTPLPLIGQPANTVAHHSNHSISGSEGQNGEDFSPVAALSPRAASHSGVFVPPKTVSCPPLDAAAGCLFSFSCAGAAVKGGMQYSVGCEMDIESIDLRRSSSGISCCTPSGKAAGTAQLSAGMTSAAQLHSTFRTTACRRWGSRDRDEFQPFNEIHITAGRERISVSPSSSFTSSSSCALFERNIPSHSVCDATKIGPEFQDDDEPLSSLIGTTPKGICPLSFYGLEDHEKRDSYVERPTSQRLAHRRRCSHVPQSRSSSSTTACDISKAGFLFRGLHTDSQTTADNIGHAVNAPYESPGAKLFYRDGCYDSPPTCTTVAVSTFRRRNHGNAGVRRRATRRSKQPCEVFFSNKPCRHRNKPCHFLQGSATSEQAEKTVWLKDGERSGHPTSKLGCMRSVKGSAANPKYKTKICPLFRTNGCPRASAECKFAHGLGELRGTREFFKTQICSFWSAGFCRAGWKCRHAHGLEDLRDAGQECAGNMKTAKTGVTTTLRRCWARRTAARATSPSVFSCYS